MTVLTTADYFIAYLYTAFSVINFFEIIFFRQKYQYEISTLILEPPPPPQ
jgi:hypothetical protein